MSLSHAIVWIDHQEAHVIQFNAEASESEIIKTKSKHTQVHQKAGVLGSGHHSADQNYLHQVVEAVAGSDEILIVGPGSAKLELFKHAQNHDTKISEKVVGIETVDHPTDGQLLAHAKKYFVKIDNMKAL
ncbi:MAG: translational machinery protein [Methylophilus sp.]|nr:translational machinery protein [Methylophilus sp.]